MKQAVFKVTTAAGSGTCFYLQDKNIFVTNQHVVGTFKKVCIQANTGNRYIADVVLDNPVEDIALLVTKDLIQVPQIELQLSEFPRQGDKVFVIGYPFGMPFTITDGMISAASQLMNGRHYIQTDAAVNPGNSGGPMIDGSGKVIGITSSKLTNADNMGFGIPVATLIRQLDALPSLKPGAFHLVCDSCSSLMAAHVEYCINCGQGIAAEYFNEPAMSDLAHFCEDAIADAGVNPVLTRQGQEYWQFYAGSSQIRMFVFNNLYFFITSPINTLPAQQVAPVLEELLAPKIAPFQLGLLQNEIYISYRFAISDIFTQHRAEIKKHIIDFFQKANEMDDYFVSRHGCQYSAYSRKNQ